MSARASAFELALREIAVPALAPHGFRFDGRRTFRRRSEDGRICRIVNFQLGQRSMAGKFTVNLGVFVEGDGVGIDASRANAYDCHSARRTRIGALMPRRFTRFAALPFIGFLFGGLDKWWAFSEDAARTRAAVSVAMDTVVAHGLDWLATRES